MVLTQHTISLLPFKEIVFSLKYWALNVANSVVCWHDKSNEASCLQVSVRVFNCSTLAVAMSG